MTDANVQGMGAMSDPLFFVMPEEYRHGAAGKKLAEPKAAPPKVVAPPAPIVAPPAPVPAIAPSAPLAAWRRKRRQRVVIAALSILALAAALATYLFVRYPVSAPTPAVPERPAKTRPAPETTPAAVTEPEEEAKPEEEAQSPFPSARVPGVDTDSDGLTDVEERLVYQTNHRLPDTDADGFLDGNEVFHRYNPAGTAPGTLAESGLVRFFEGPVVEGNTMPAVKYSILYPSIWGLVPAAGETLDAPVTIVATTGETVAVSLAKADGKSDDPAAWYAAFGDGKPVEAMTTKNGYKALLSEDQLTAYVFGKDLLVIVKMTPGSKATVDYLQTFKMMLNSVHIL